MTRTRSWDQTRLPIFLTSFQYRQINSTQALKESKRPNTDPCSYTRVRLTLTLARCASIGSWRERHDSHRARLDHPEVRHTNSVRSKPEGRTRLKNIRTRIKIRVTIRATVTPAWLLQAPLLVHRQPNIHISDRQLHVPNGTNDMYLLVISRVPGVCYMVASSSAWFAS